MRRTHFHSRLSTLLALWRRQLRRLLRHAGRQPGHLARVLRRLKSRIKARRQGDTGTELR